MFNNKIQQKRMKNNVNQQNTTRNKDKQKSMETKHNNKQSQTRKSETETLLNKKKQPKVQHPMLIRAYLNLFNNHDEGPKDSECQLEES